MIRIRIRICAVAALLAASLLTGSVAADAEVNAIADVDAGVGDVVVPTTCTVNDMTVTGTTITGTDAADEIECENGVNDGTTITGLGGADLIEVTGTNAGTLDGGTGADLIDVDDGNLATGIITGGGQGDVIDVSGQLVGNAGRILGGVGGDVIFVTAEAEDFGTANTGVIDGEAGRDVCVLDPEVSGSTTCEIVV